MSIFIFKLFLELIAAFQSLLIRAVHTVPAHTADSHDAATKDGRRRGDCVAAQAEQEAA